MQMYQVNSKQKKMNIMNVYKEYFFLIPLVYTPNGCIKLY